MIYVRTEFIYAVLLVAPFIEGTQAILQVRTPIELKIDAESPTTPSSSSPSASSTPMLSFESLPQPTSCGTATFSWSYSGPDNPILLQVTDVGVSQDTPPPSTSLSAASTRELASVSVRSVPSVPISPANVTITLASDYPPTSLSYVWDTVSVSAGWYILLATIPQQPIQHSSPFLVSPGSNTTCLGSLAPSSTTASPSPSRSSASSSTSAASIPASNLSSNTSNTRTVVGVTVGMVVLVIAAISIWLLLRKRKSRASSSPQINSHRWNSTDSQTGFGANATNKRYFSSRSHLTSQPGSIATTLALSSEDGTEKGANQSSLKVSEEHDVTLSSLPVLHHQSSRHSSRTRPDHHTYSSSSSTLNLNNIGVPVANKPSRYPVQPPIPNSPSVYPPSFPVSSRGSTHDITVAPNIARAHSENTTNTQNSFDHTSHRTSSLSSPLSSFQFPQPPNSFANRENTQTNRMSLNLKRKPVPVYDASEEDLPSSSGSGISPVYTHPPVRPYSANVGSLAFPVLSHRSSFGRGGDDQQVHYLIPDMPTTGRSL